MALKWGIVSAGNISTSFVKSLTILPKDHHTVIAVAARDIEKAKQFAQELKIPKAYGTYEEIAKDDEINIVYIGNIHPKHFEVAKTMLEHGKHVLCEKPMTMNQKDTAELVKIAKKQGKFLMEAIWSRCFPAYAKVKELIANKSIGEVKYVAVRFGKNIKHVPRLNLKELGGGTILDLGVYAFQFQQMVFGLETPLSMVARGHLNNHGTDESANIIITYDNGRTAVLSTHACLEFDNTAYIVGEKGTIRVPYFYKPTDVILDDKSFHFDLPKGDYEGYRVGGMSYQAEEVYDCIKKGLLESPKITHEESVALAGLMDEAMRQLGVTFS